MSDVDYIEIPNNGALDVRYSMTLMAWLCLNKIQDGAIIEYAGPQGTHLWIYKSKLYVSIIFGQAQSQVTHKLHTHIRIENVPFLSWMIDSFHAIVFSFPTSQDVLLKNG